MITVPIEKLQFNRVVTPDEEELITEMAESIRDQGLIHPITIREEDFKVIAGRKRILAVMRLGQTEIHAEVRGGLDADRALELAIHENVKRTNLPWFDRAELYKLLHELRQKQHGIKKGGRPRNDGANVGGWSLGDTARELGMALGPLSEDLTLAKAVQADPRLKNVKDRKTALRLVKIEARRAEMEADALWEEETTESIKNQVLNGSSAEILRRFPENTFGLCLTDPPWIKYIKAELTQDEETLPVFKEVYRVLKKDALLFMFVGFEDFFFYKEHLPGFGFTISNTPLIWWKQGQGVTYGVRPWEYNRDYELILLAAKGSPVLTGTVAKSSILAYPPIAPKILTHPNEKPQPLIRSILEDASFEGMHVLDPFAGSGVVGDVCKQIGRAYTMIERDPLFYEKIVKRLAK